MPDTQVQFKLEAARYTIIGHLEKVNPLKYRFYFTLILGGKAVSNYAQDIPPEIRNQIIGKVIELICQNTSTVSKYWTGRVTTGLVVVEANN